MPSVFPFQYDKGGVPSSCFVSEKVLGAKRRIYVIIAGYKAEHCQCGVFFYLLQKKGLHGPQNRVQRGKVLACPSSWYLWKGEKP